MDRREGLAKLAGHERYVDDLAFDGAWWGATVRSPSPRGRVRAIRFPAWMDRSRFVIVDHRDIPGRNCVRLIEDDQPALAAERVRHVHEPILLLAHPSREVARRAAAEIEVEIDPEPAYLDFRRPPSPEEIQLGDANVIERLEIVKGDVERALAEAAVVVEGVYETGAQEHVYLENQGMVAWLDGDVLVVQGSMQCPFYVAKALCHLLARDEARLRVIQAPTGGAFGGKEEYPSTIAAHAALLALAAGRPVKLVYERPEDLAATTKRHPSRTRHRWGLTEDGRLLAQDVELVLDGGAYVTLSPVVLSRAIIHAAGPYRCDHVRIRGRAMFTNHVPFGAFRGFGNPQACFALERHVDVAARRLGIDAVELRRRNLIRDGDSTSTGQVIRDGTDRAGLLDRALELARWSERRAEHGAFNAAHATRRRGLGLATFYHGAGFTGAGEVHLDSLVHVAGLPDGRVEVRTACTEMGQGTWTIFTQLAADRLGLPPELIEIAPQDTHRVPNSGPTVASRTAMIVGRLVEKACDDLRRRVGLTDDARGPVVRAAIVAWHRERQGDEPIGVGRYERPPGVRWDEEAYRGDAYEAFAWSTQVAEVEVDLRTCDVEVTDFVAVQEVGRPLNEVLARGQIQGGVVQGIGWALLEDVIYAEGAMQNSQLTNYLIPTSEDVPPIRVEFVENPYPFGAQGAKGLGELPIVGPAPAIANAVADALGVEPTAIPLTPERLLALTRDGARRSA